MRWSFSYHSRGSHSDIEGVTADPATVLETVKAYDQAVMGLGEYPDVGKGIASRTIGNVDKTEDGKYIPETYNLEDTDLIVRLMAPSTHHTMGGIVVDTQRHVLNADGAIILWCVRSRPTMDIFVAPLSA